MIKLVLLYLTTATCYLFLPASTQKITTQSDQLLESFKEMNLYLARAVRSEDPELNLDKMADLLNEKGSTNSLVEAAKVFVSLRDTVDKCDPESQFILSENDRVTEGRARNSNSKKWSRVEWIVNLYCTNHAKHCQKVYRTNFETVHQQMDVEQKKHVETLTDLIIVLHYFHKTRIYGDQRIVRLYNDIIMTESPIRGINSARTLFIAIGDLTRDDPDSKYLSYVVDYNAGKKIIHKDKIKHLFEKYVFKPCKYYVDQLNTVFVPAKFDAQWHHEILYQDHVFYYSWARFSFCQSLIDSDLEKTVEGLVHMAEISA